MSADKLQQGIPIIIKGGCSKGIMASPIQIQANGIFQVTQSFQSQPSDWIQSDSDFMLSYVESVMVGEMGNNLQFCQNSSMAHPLTYEFQTAKSETIFTISEVTDASNYYLNINVINPDTYFQIDQQSSSASGNWTTSTFNTVDVTIDAVEVVDANKVPVCRLLVADCESIYLNLEPAI